ncbi:hypothetical protein JK628_08870 [Shewanella sp. KX20019]|uniref:hypothetical protein n=1 Tax=Shewanella sp. KX20019 TaxID=2803864 RepID=UPI0019261154|nr:hypothetical protein [Shewanella sp. KX20019]QQX81901.1 hypothetical protein JK628_08870 [Shewanella sp. KX20019]
MSKFLILAFTLLTPTLAFAHEGHGGIGLFHHFMDLAPALALLVVIAAGVMWVKKRK